MSRASPREAWRTARARGIGVEGAEVLRAGQTLLLQWFPPTRIADGPVLADQMGGEYSFRLHQQSDGWIVEGNNGGPWEVCEGPIIDFGRPPWLARPKDIGEPSCP